MTNIQKIVDDASLSLIQNSKSEAHEYSSLENIGELLGSSPVISNWAFLTLDLASKGHQVQSSENSLAKLYSHRGCQRLCPLIKACFYWQAVVVNSKS